MKKIQGIKCSGWDFFQNIGCIIVEKAELQKSGF